MIRVPVPGMALCIGAFALVAWTGPQGPSPVLEPQRPDQSAPRLQVQIEHAGSIQAITVHDHVFATAGKDGTARLWELQSGRLLRVFVGHGSQINCVAISPDGEKVATGSGILDERDKSARVWSVASGEELRRFDFSTAVTAVAFSPDGAAILVGTADDGVSLWSVDGGVKLWSFDPNEGKGPVLVGSGISSVAFSRDGRFALTSGPRLRIWSTAPLPWREEQVSKQSLWDAVFIGNATTPIQAATSPEVRLAASADGTVYARSTTEFVEVMTAVAQETLLSLGERVSRPRPIALSDDGTWIVTTDGVARLRIVNVATHKTVFARGDALVPSSAVFASDGRALAIGDAAGSAYLWSVTDGRLRGPYAHGKRIDAIALSEDGNYLLTASDTTARLFSVSTAEPIWTQPHREPIRSVAFAPTGSVCLVGGLNTIDLRRVRDGQLAGGMPDRHITDIETARFAENDKTLLIASGPRVLFVSTDGWNVAAQFGAAPEDLKAADRLRAAGFARGGKLYPSGLEAGPEIPLPPNAPPNIPDGLVSTGNGTLSVIGTDYQVALPRPAGHTEPVLSIAGGPSAPYLVTGAEDQTAIVWSTQTRGLRTRLEGHRDYVRSVGLSTDGMRVVTGGATSVKLWTLQVGAPRLEWTKFTTAMVRAVHFSADGARVLALTSDASIWLWDAKSGEELARTAVFEGGRWVVTEPGGHLDTNTIENIDGLHWIMPNDTNRPLSPELFLRDYYEPRLLTRVVAGEALPAVRPLASLNRVQPTVEIEQVAWTDPAAGRAMVTVKVARASDTFPRDGRPMRVTTDGYDLRLFRDGQLVGWAPESAMTWQQERSATDGSGPQADLPRWRALTHLAPGAAGSTQLTFPVQVPRRVERPAVTFTAYAFNEDRVKSATATKTVAVPTSLVPRRGRAYVIGVGVNRTESSPAWDLQYAVKDARALVEAVTTRLEAGQQFAEVVPIRLVSDAVPPQRDETAATKAHLQVVLDRLAGRPVAAARLAEVPNAARMQRAEPEDVVLLGVSSHGYTDPRGIFHFVLADIGAHQRQEVTRTLEQRTLSSDELSRWLRAVDAGELVLIVDACHSEATVTADGFKPGPMGSRGLGQLAYDKGMRVLAASKAQEAAIERGGQVQQGLLTYALVREGLDARQADFAPPDGTITLAEWLAYAVDAVPRLFAEGDARGSVAVKGAPEGTRDAFHGRQRTPARYQQPVLFDFAKRQPALVLMSRSNVLRPPMTPRSVLLKSGLQFSPALK